VVLQITLLQLLIHVARAQDVEPPNTDPLQAWQAWYEPRAYPLGYIPAGARIDAAQQWGQATVAAGGSAGAGAAWLNIGPAPILISRFGISLGSGRVTAIAVDPALPNHWLVGAAQGGIWETGDGGSTWAPRSDDQDSLAIGAIAFAQSNPPGQKIVYAGTGEIDHGQPSLGVGFLKSTDGGGTWRLVAGAPFLGRLFSRIEVDPAGSQVVLAATSTGIYRSTDGGLTWPEQPLARFVTRLEVDPTNFNRQYAGVAYDDDAAGLYRSVDGGRNWGPVSGPWLHAPPQPAGDVGVVALAIAPTNPNVLYVGIHKRGPAANLKGLWRTDNAWGSAPTWNSISTAATDAFGSPWLDYCAYFDPLANGPAGQCFYDNVLSVDRGTPDILYAGGIPMWRYDQTSLPGTWSDIGDKTVPPGLQLDVVHVDQHAIAWTGNRLIVGNDGGVYSTTDGGDTWSNHNTGLSIAQFYRGSLHPTNPNAALGGAQDNGSSQFTGASRWEFVYGGDGGDNFFASVNRDPDQNFAVSFVQGLFILRRVAGINGLCSTEPDPDSNNVPFNSPFEKCPTSDDIVIAGSHDIWETNQFFNPVCSPPPVTNVPWTRRCLGTTQNEPITALSFAPLSPACSKYAFGARDGTLRLNTFGTDNCADLNANPDGGRRVPNGSVTDLAFDPTNPNTLYATLSGFQSGHVFRTANALAPEGQTEWFDVTPKVNGISINMPFNTVALDPAAPNFVYVGTDMGVLVSPDCGATWTALSNGLPKVQVNDLQVSASGDRLVAFTFGRGAFQLQLAPQTPATCPPPPTATPTPTRTSTPTPSTTPTATRIPGPCVGDCNDDGFVTLSEVETMVDVALANLALSSCPGADADHDGAVMVTEIVQAENDVFGCTAPGGPPGSALVRIGSASTSPTAQVSVPVSLAQSGGAVAAVQLDLLYDSSIFRDPSCTIEPRLGQHTLYTSLPTSPPAPAGQTRLRLMVLNPSSPSLLTDGVLARCRFSVASTAAAGTYAIVGERLGGCDAAGVPCSTGVTNGQVTVSSAYIRVVANYPGGGRAVGAGLQDYFGVILSSGASVDVTVTTLTPGLCRVWSASPGDGVSTTITAASAANLFWVQGVAGALGTCELMAAAAGYATGFSWLSIVRPAIVIASLPNSIVYAAANAVIYVETGIPTGDNYALAESQAVWEGGPGFDITVSNSNASVAQLFSPTSPAGAQVVTVTIPAGDYYNSDGGLQFDPLAIGTTTVTARHPVALATTHATRAVEVIPIPPAPPSCSGCC